MFNKLYDIIAKNLTMKRASMEKSINTTTRTLTDLKLEAQKIAFAPFAFQAVKVMRDNGILKEIEKSKDDGIDFDKLLDNIDISRYGLGVLLDAGLSVGIIDQKDNKYVLTKVGYFILNDEITRVHMDFTHDVCYQGMFFLDEAIKNGKPAGLKVFGEWPTVYEGLSSLPEKVKESWFNFDHYFSDMAFPKALPIVFKDNPQTLLDIGGNTGKWTIECLKFSKEVKITIMDLPGQLKKAKENVEKNNLGDRVDYYTIDILDKSKPFPKNFDIIWMSQFLDCFSEDEIVSILTRAKESMNENSILYIMETFTDRQHFNVASYCLDMISLYFTCIANGNSRMYHADDMIRCIEKAGLKVVEDINGVAISHTLLKCKK